MKLIPGSIDVQNLIPIPGILEWLFHIDRSATPTKKGCKKYLLRSIEVGTLDWAVPFPADASSTSQANKGAVLSVQDRAHGLGLTAIGPG